MIVNIKNLSFGYDKNLVLNNINLNYDCSEFLSIIGPNGGGKSTLLKLILGLITPASGSITINGTNPSKSCKLIGYVPQNIPINKSFPISVLEVVLMGRIDKKRFGFYSAMDKKIAKEALETVSMSEFHAKSISQLSGGQRQRVYIARALASQAKMLLLDEPTSSIDTRGQAEIYSILKEINANKIGIIMVSHDINMAINFASKVAYVNRELFLHEITQQNRLSFINHLSANHAHFCDVEILLKQCDCGAKT